jgi:hypothetical protein
MMQDYLQPHVANHTHQVDLKTPSTSLNVLFGMIAGCEPDATLHICLGAASEYLALST